MYPSVSSARVINSRRIVVVPEPLGPMRVTRSPRATSKFRPSSTVVGPNFFTTSWKRMMGSLVGKAVLQFAHEDGRGVTRGQEDQAGDGEGFDVPEGVAPDVAGVDNHLRCGGEDLGGCGFEHQ